MTYYVAGFMFSEDLKKVALIVKNKPEWQAGKLNAIGGKIEGAEAPIDAMTREFKEETGVSTDATDWHLYCSLGDNRGYRVYFFFTVSKKVFSVETMEDEDVMIVPSSLDGLKIIPNLQWLVPMAKEIIKSRDASPSARVQSYQVIEI